MPTHRFHTISIPLYVYLIIYETGYKYYYSKIYCFYLIKAKGVFSLFAIKPKILKNWQKIISQRPVD